MNKMFAVLGILIVIFIGAGNLSAQGDVRSAIGLPIPVGASVIWGQVEIKGLKPKEKRPIVTVLLLAEGVEIGRSQLNDQGYYYFLEKARDGAFLVVTVGGTEVGRQPIYSSRGDRFDMVINWSEGLGADGEPGVVSVKDAYAGRSAENSKRFDKASAAAKDKNTGEAIKIFNEIVTADPNDFVAWTELGTLYFGSSKASDAEKAYKKALELKPDFAIALVNLGKLYLSEKKIDPAVETLTKAVAAEPNSPEAHHYLGEAYLQARKGSLAVGHLNKAIELAPVAKAEVHLRLATLYNAAGMKDRAVAEYKAFLGKVKDYPEAKKIEAYIKENSPK